MNLLIAASNALVLDPDSQTLSVLPADLNIPWWAQIIFSWLGHQPTLVTLLILIGIDVIMGVGLSIVKRTLSSSIAWRGMMKKTFILLILGAVAAVGPIMPDVPTFELACIGFIIAEFISILEGAAAVGLPLPAVLVNALVKLREHQATLAAQKTGITSVPGNTGGNFIIVNPAGSTTSAVSQNPPVTHTTSTVKTESETTVLP